MASVNFNPAGSVARFEPTARKQEAPASIAPETSAPPQGESVTLSGLSIAPAAPPRSEASVVPSSAESKAAPSALALDLSGSAFAGKLGPALSAPSGPVFLHFEQPTVEHSSLDNFLSKLAGGGAAVKASVSPDQLDFDSGAQVVSSAQKFVIPVPKFADGGEPLVYPKGTIHKEGADISGCKICDWQGKPVGDKGLVFYNPKDKAWQAVPGDGQGVVILNQVTEEQAKQLQEKIGSDPTNLTLSQFKDVLGFAAEKVGLNDMYNSDRSFIESKMNPMETQSTGVPQYGLFRRDDRDICHAVFLEGSGEFKGSATVHQFENGGVAIRQKSGNEFTYRLCQTKEFVETYNNKDGSKIDPDKLPRGLQD